MTINLALDARCNWALFKVIGRAKDKERVQALQQAYQCGYDSFPEGYVPLYFADTPVLIDEFKKGLDSAIADNKPMSDTSLQEMIDLLATQANHGCGQFYELYAQKFNSLADEWLYRLKDVNKPAALRLLKKADYDPKPTGYYTYDQEENDITFVSYT